MQYQWCFMETNESSSLSTASARVAVEINHDGLHLHHCTIVNWLYTYQLAFDQLLSKYLELLNSKYMECNVWIFIL